jgi:hypothetical protein
MERKYVELKDKVHRYHYLGACLILQSHFRGYRVRKRFATLINAVCKIQSFVRARWLRIYFLDLRKQVIKIQRIFRRYRLRRIKSKEMLLRMIHQIENVNAFQVVENALLYGVDQKTTLQYVFDINKGKRVDFVEILQNKAKDMTILSDLDIKRGRLRSKSRDRMRKIKLSVQNLYKDMEEERDPEWRRIKKEHMRQNLYVRNLSPGKTWRNFGKEKSYKDEKLDMYVSIVEKGELSSAFVRIRKDLEDQANKLKDLYSSLDYQGKQHSLYNNKNWN